jgi:hypothetical protein
VKASDALSLLALAAALAACDKDKKDAPPTPVPSAAPMGSASSAASAAAAPAGPKTFEGKYTAAAGSLYVPDASDYAGFKFRGEDAATSLGEGTLSLVVDDKTGQVTGTGDGAFGPIVVSGARNGDTVTFSFWRKDPSDQGPTGTGQATVSGDRIEGSLRASPATANVLREAPFTLSKK